MLRLCCPFVMGQDVVCLIFNILLGLYSSDMAHLLLNKEISRVWSKELGEARYLCPQIEFWQKAVPVVKAQFPEAVLLAEVLLSM